MSRPFHSVTLAINADHEVAEYFVCHRGPSTKDFEKWLSLYADWPWSIFYSKVTTGACAVVTKIKKWYLKNNKCKVTNLPPSLRKKGVLCSTHIQLHLAWFSPFTNTPSRIRQATFNARRIHGFFFSFFTGKVLRLKLIRLNSHHDRFCRSRDEVCCFQQKQHNCVRQPYYVITPESLARRWKSQTREVRTRHSIGLFWTAKKVTKGNEHFFVRKILRS